MITEKLKKMLMLGQANAKHVSGNIFSIPYDGIEITVGNLKVNNFGDYVVSVTAKIMRGNDAIAIQENTIVIGDVIKYGGIDGNFTVTVD